MRRGGEKERRRGEEEKRRRGGEEDRRRGGGRPPCTPGGGRPPRTVCPARGTPPASRALHSVQVYVFCLFVLNTGHSVTFMLMIP